MLLRRFSVYIRYPERHTSGAGGTFCAGADLKAIAAGEQRKLTEDAPAPLGPTRLLLGKPVLAAVEGHAVAGGLESSRSGATSASPPSTRSSASSAVKQLTARRPRAAN